MGGEEEVDVEVEGLCDPIFLPDIPVGERLTGSWYNFNTLFERRCEVRSMVCSVSLIDWRNDSSYEIRSKWKWSWPKFKVIG